MDAPRIPPADEQLALLRRGVVDLHPLDDLEARLARSHATQTPLVIKTGFDPTAPDLHLGHTVLMEKMRQFQQLGHRVVFLVGDYTALIGDPTGRNALRPPLSEAQIAANAATYTEQCWKILDRDHTTVEWNSRWLAGMSFKDVIVLASSYTLGRMLERRDFKGRFEGNQPINLHEFLYPLIQGYDSVVLQADVELGGHDQIFNLNVGRHLMEARGLRPQIVLTVPLLVGVDGVDKMSKSKGNHIGITEPAEDIFGKVMRISDETMWGWIPLLTGATADRTADPLATKKALAQEIVRRFHGTDAAETTRGWWDGGHAPRAVEEREVAANALFHLVLAVGGASSGSDARRKIAQGGVSLDGVRQTDAMRQLTPGSYRLRVGKRFEAVLKVV